MKYGRPPANKETESLRHPRCLGKEKGAESTEKSVLLKVLLHPETVRDGVTPRAA